MMTTLDLVLAEIKAVPIMMIVEMIMVVMVMIMNE